jgi:hypothetical protein
LAEQLEKAWYDVVGVGNDTELRAVLINGGRLTGREAGFVISPARTGLGERYGVHALNGDGLVWGNAEFPKQTGDGPNWFEQNRPEIQKRADSGDEEMRDLLEEIRTGERV